MLPRFKSAPTRELAVSTAKLVAKGPAHDAHRLSCAALSNVRDCGLADLVSAPCSQEPVHLGPMLETMVGDVAHKIAAVAVGSQPTLVQFFIPSIDAAAAAVADHTPGCTRQRHMENCAASGSLHDRSSADNGAAILDSLGFAVDPLRNQPAAYGRAILLISETPDRRSRLEIRDAVREPSDTDTAIFSIGFSTRKSEAAHYAY